MVAAGGTPLREFLMSMSATDKRKFAKYRSISRIANRMQFAIRQRQGLKRLGLNVLGFLIVVVLLVFLGPFGTWASLGNFDRLLFWTTTVSANWLVAHVVFSATIQSFVSRNWPTSAALVLAALATALPGTGTVWLALSIYLGHQPSDVRGVIELYAKVLVLHLIIGAFVYHFIEKKFRRREIVGETGTSESSTRREGVGSEPAAPPEAALLARLPVHARAELLHLRMQDHYVEVHTSAGCELLLLRFRDALREVEQVNGLQVHRSHWVARNAVAGVERRRGGRVILRLVNGSRVPVSRSFASALKMHGWI